MTRIEVISSLFAACIIGFVLGTYTENSRVHELYGECIEDLIGLWR